MIETGTILQQRYRIDRQIGQGGMGAVYIGTDERFGSVVAIKETLCMDDNFRKAIEREARLLNSLKHNALPRVSDHFEERGSQFLVMEYIPGEDVATMLEVDHTQFSVDQVLKWADQLLDALDYLHHQDVPVVHRDIKPQNLKVNSRGDIILLDFGLAKGNPTDAGHQTAAKSIFGYSRNYASLEQIQGTGTDPRSDLYSLAATLYHLLANVAPEDALTRAMAVLSQRPDPLVPANQMNASVPRGVAGVLQKALDLNADGRPANATEMRQMLRESENYGYLADNAAVGILAPVVPGPAAPTMIMPEETRAAAALAGGVSASTHPDNVSQVTSIRPGLIDQTAFAHAATTEAPSNGRRGLAMAAGMAVVLLVGAAAAGGLYMIKPSVFGLGADEKVVDVPVSPTDTNTGGEVSVTGGDAGSAPDGGTSDQTTVPATDPGRSSDTSQIDTTKPAKAPGNDRPGKQTGTDQMDGDFEQDFSGPDEITITTNDRDGTVTTRKVTPPDRQPRSQDPEEFIPIPRGFDPSKMTPEQRRIFQDKIFRRVVRPNLPAPPPRPKN
ncbi:MAG: serine/threonine protein kinase [Pyrinomonadaceae bacterium]|nr:serine/threonine protein kinase [Pyrinomonadaceae bacterium]